MITNKVIFEAFHETLLNEGGNNNTWWLYNEDKTALIIYTESEPSNINRFLIEREGGEKYIDIDKVKQAREEIDKLDTKIAIRDTPQGRESYFIVDQAEVLKIIDKLIAESEGE